MKERRPQSAFEQGRQAATPGQRGRRAALGKRGRVRAQREVEAERRERNLEAWRRRRDAARERREVVRERARRERHVTLVDLIERLLDGGVVIHGDITLAVADVDLLYVGLRAMIASVETIEQEMGVSLTARGPTLSASAL
jgi:gas vesicle structural protein